MGTDNQNSQENATEEVRTFTQDEVNSFLAKDRKQMAERYADYDELKEKAARLDQIEEDAKSELQKATERAEKLQAELSAMKHADEIRTIRDKVAQSTGVPASLLTGDTEEACNEQAAGILSFKTTAAYPTVRDGGEIRVNNKVDARSAFKEWALQVND